MGTRADFYAGKGKTAEWLGSIAWNGYRDGIPAQILQCQSEEAFRHSVVKFIAGRKDGTKPDEGWPWPWDDSSTSDCYYWFFDGKCWDAVGSPEVYAPCDVTQPDWDEPHANYECVEFPDMKKRKNVKLSGAGSGLIIITPNGVL